MLAYLHEVLLNQHPSGRSRWSVAQVQERDKTHLLTCLLEGASGSGKTAIAATLGIESGFPFVKVISSSSMMGYTEAAKASYITKIIEDSYRVRLKCLGEEGKCKVASPLSAIVHLESEKHSASGTNGF